MPQTDLETLVFQMDANISSLDKAMAKAIRIVDGSAGEMEKRLKKTEGGFSKFGEGAEIGKSLDKIFDSTRLAVIDAGAEKLRIFGSALEPLGGLGIAAAAGIAAVGGAMEKAKEAAEWAENIQVATEKLGTTAGSVQELQFGGASHGVSSEETIDSLEKLNEELGKVQAGGPRARQALAMLGMTQEEVERFRTIDDFLPELAERIKNLSPAEGASLAEKMGVSKLLPILKEGKEGLQGVRDEANKLGVVMGDNMVAKAAAANTEINKMSAVMQGDLHRAFVDMLPAVTGLEGAIADLVGGFAKLIEKAEAFGHVAPAYNYMKQIAAANARINELQGQHGLTIDMGGIENGSSRAAQIAQQKAIIEEATKNLQTTTIDNHAFDPKGGPPKPVQLIPDKVKAAPADQTAELDKATKDELEDAAKAYASAQKALAGTLEERAAAERQELEAASAKKLGDLNAESQKIAKSKNDSDKDNQQKRVAAAEALEKNTIALQEEALARRTASEAIEANSALEQKDASLQETALDRAASMATSQASLTNSTSERISYERQALADQQQRDRVKAQADVDLALAELAAAEALKDQDKIKTAQANLGGAIAAQAILPVQQGLQTADFNKKNQGPLAQWADEAAGEAKNVGDTFQKKAVKGINDFNKSLADSIVNSNNFGQAFKSILKEIEADLIQLILKQAEVGIFGGTTGQNGNVGIGGFLGGLLTGKFASGTDNAPGGLALVGENGPEVVQLPGGSGVTPNSVLKSLAGRSNVTSSGPAVVHQHFNLSAPNAIMTHEFIAGINSKIQTMGQVAATAGAKGGHQMTMDAISTKNRYSLR